MYSLLLLVFSFSKIFGSFLIDDNCIFVGTDPEKNATESNLTGVYRLELIENFAI